MSQEDLFSQLTLSLTQKQDPDDLDDNTVLFRMVSPMEVISLRENITMAHSIPSIESWGGTGITTNWFWGAGQWM